MTVLFARHLAAIKTISMNSGPQHRSMPKYLHIFFIALAVVTGVISYRRMNALPLRLFLLFLLYTLLNECIAYWMMSQNIRNHWLYNIYNYVRFPLLAIIYYFLINNPQFKKIIAGFLLSIPLLLAVNMYVYGTFYQLHTLAILYGSVFIIFLTICFLRQLLYLPLEDSILHHPFFWISSGLLFYFLGNVPFLGALNYLIANNPGVAVQLYTITRILNILMYSLFTVAFIITWRHMKSPILS